MEYRYFEVMLDDGYSICIKGTRKPSVDEAAAFLSENDLKGRKVVYVEEWDRRDAETAFDFEREADWPVFAGESQRSGYGAVVKYDEGKKMLYVNVPAACDMW